MERLGPDSDGMKKIDAVDFLGMTEGAIEEERREYVIMNPTKRDLLITCHWHSRRRCYNALQILNKLIPRFSEKARAQATENAHIFCAPVCESVNPTTSC